VGTHLAKMLSVEEQDIIVMDVDNKKLEPLENYNLLTHQGSAISFSDLNAIKTGMCDLFIAVTKSEARNILACSMAKKLGARKTVARVDNDEFFNSKWRDHITNLGIDNVEQIRKGAAIAKSNAQREIAIAEAANAKQANDAKVQAQEEIAKRNNDLAIKQARLQKEADQERAQAEAAKGIEAENQRKLKEVAETDANIARAQREAELKQKQIELKEYELDAIVRKQADADKYQAEKVAEAELGARQRKADAERYEQEQAALARMKAAEAAKYAREQEAAGIRAVGEAEAEAIRAKALAEAEGIDKKAEAMKKYGEAAIIEMIVGALPEIAKNVAEPLSKVDKITMYGEGNSAKLIGDIVNGTSQITEGMTQGLGLDLRALLAGALGGKLAAGIAAPESPAEPAEE
jgi:flotillin